jgi:Zn-dependent peptidase ImmA (M78 family)
VTSDRELGLRRARAEAKALLRRFGVRSAAHIKVEAFAAAFGIKIVEGKLDGARARLKTKPKPVIRVSDRPIAPGEWRFCVTHELGHHVLDHATVRVDALCDRRPAQPPGTTRHAEAEANTYAAEVLMPSDLVGERCAVTQPDLDIARSIAEEFGTTLGASAIRVAELSPERCAAIYSEAGRIVWAVRSPTFTARIERGRALDRASVAYDYFATGSLDERPQPIPADAWLETSSSDDLIEHSVAIPDTRGVITLLWVAESSADLLP